MINLTSFRLLTTTAAASTVLIEAFLSPQPAFALNQIIRPYASIRSAGMGGVRYTTGLYDENFFNNPARVTANPRFRFTLIDPMIEGSSSLIDTVSKISGDGDTIKKISSTAGTNNHGRVQMTSPAIYFAPGEEGKWGFAFALITSSQFDIALRENFSFVPQATTDVGPAFTLGRKFLDENRLSVGMTTHFIYRFQTAREFTFLDFLRDTSLSPLDSSGQGAMLDFDLGATYRLPVGEGSPFRYTVAASINNLLGGGYSHFSMNLIPNTSCNQPGGKCLPNAQPRTYNFGISATRQTWWKFIDTTFALEFTDIGNNPDGSLFRTVHLGAETHWSVFTLRMGINQGYWATGLGIDLRYFTLDFATYGEEMSLNVGGQEDRRYAFKLALQI